MLKRVDRVRAEWTAGQGQAQAQAQDSSTNNNNNNDSTSSNKSGGGRYSLVLLDEIGTGKMVCTSVYVIVQYTAIACMYTCT